MSASLLADLLLLYGYRAQDEINYGTNGILAQKKWLRRCRQTKNFSRIQILHRDFRTLSSIEKLTAAQRVQE